MLVRRYGDFAAAEDAVQEALLAATTRWATDGVPERPSAWLVQTASRRMIDARRSEHARRMREERAALQDIPAPDVEARDDSLALLFMCCHPALSTTSAIALTLRAVAGLTTAEIAHAFLVGEPAMAQRITRAKHAIRSSGAPFRMPSAEEMPERKGAVLRVLYLIFNEGYASHTGRDLLRTDLSDEAIRLARMMHASLPTDGEVAGLLALMLLVDARRPARVDAAGDPVPLPEQDRSLWNRRLIAEGTALLDAAFARGAVGEYQLQAAIAALHDHAPSATETDWPQVLALYEILERMTPGPMVTLSKAVARAMVHGPRAGLDVIDGIDDGIAGHFRVEAVRAHLLEMVGEDRQALERYRAAAAGATNLAERRRLTTRAARLHDRLSH